MRKITTIFIIALILITAIVVKTNPALHKTFLIERLIITKGVN